MKNKKPMIKETVGSLYTAFNTPNEQGEYDSSTYEETIKKASSIDMAVEVVAFDPATLARMRGEDTSDNGGLILSGAPSRRPFFAFGKVVKKIGGGVQYAWYPKCQLVENTDDIATSEDTFSEQNDTITIRAYAFDDNKQKKSYVDSETEHFPEGLTEEKFFAKPIITAADLAAAVAPGA